MGDPAYPFFFTSARPHLDCPRRILRYGKHNGQPRRIIASKGNDVDAPLNQVEFENGDQFWVTEDELDVEPVDFTRK